MFNIRHILLVTFVYCLSMTSAYSLDFNDVKKSLKNIKGTAVLPGTDMMVITLKTGETLMMSKNGHYLVRNGEILDMWNKMVIKSFADVDKSTLIDLKKLRINIKELSTYTMGKGKSEVTIFVDPVDCRYGTKLLSQIPINKIKVNLVLLPIINKKSSMISRAIVCAKYTPAEVFSIIRECKWKSIPEKTDCSSLPLQKALVTAKIIGVKSVPNTLFSDGRLLKGSGKNVMQKIRSFY